MATVEGHLHGQSITLHSRSLFDIPQQKLPRRIDVAFYDGDHRPESQRRAIEHLCPALADTALLVIDDTNHPGVIDATRTGLRHVGATVLHEWLLPAGFNGDTEQWWNGLYVAAVSKMNSQQTGLPHK